MTAPPIRSAFTPRRRYEQQLRTARCCALLTALLLPSFSLLLRGFPHRPVWQSEGRAARFTAVAYTEPPSAAEEPQTAAPPPAPALRAPLAPPPAVLTFYHAELLPEPPEELGLDIPQEDALADAVCDITEEEAPARPATKAARSRAVAAAPAAAESPAKRTPPAYRDAPKPPYPAALRARRLGGSVGVRIAVSADGMPTDVTITSPSGHAELDRSARSWILAHWRFRPAELDGTPIAAHVQTRIDYLPD